MPSEKQTCAACGAKFEFLPAPSGKPMPVQRVHQVYKLVVKDGEQRLESTADRGFYVSHFETCSSPGRFSRKR